MIAHGKELFREDKMCIHKIKFFLKLNLFLGPDTLYYINWTIKYKARVTVRCDLFAHHRVEVCMDIDILREFKTFARSLNYSKAAREMYISQPTLVSHINMLEKATGTQLVSKENGTPIITPAGRYLLSEMEAVLESFDTLLQKCHEVGERTLSFVIRNDTAYFNSVLKEAETKYLELYGDKRIEYIFLSSPVDREEALNTGMIDFDIGASYELLAPGESPKTREISNDTLMFAQTIEEELFWVSDASPLFGKTAILPEDLNGYTIVLTDSPSSRNLGTALIQVFAKRGISVKVHYRFFVSLHEYYISNFENEIGLVSNSTKQNIGFIGPEITRKAFSLVNMPLYTCIYTKSCPAALPPAKQAFISCLEEIGKQHCSAGCRE